MLKTRSLLVVAAVAALLALPGAALAAPTTLYVGPALNTTGSCDIAHECTIDYALSKATTNGDTVYVEHGTYVHSDTDPNNPSINNSGSYVNSGVTLVGAPGLPRPTIIQNTPYTHPTGCNCGVIALLGTAQMTHVRVVQTDAAAGGAVTMQGSAKVDDSELIGAGAIGSTSIGQNGGHFNDSLLVGTTSGMGISATMTIDQSTVIVTGGSQPLNVSSSTSSGPITVGVHNTILRSLGGSSDIYAYQNGSGTTTINVDHSATRVATAFKVGGSQVNDSGGNIVTAPAFVDAAAGDYREAAGSPTINAGQGPVATLDLDGNPFTNGAPDIGAYEYYAPAPSKPAPLNPAPRILTGLKLKLGAQLRKGKFPATITCPKNAVGTCGGSVVVKQGRKTRTTRFSKVKPGETKTLKIKAKKGKASITVTVTDSAGATGTVTASKKLK